MDWNTLYEMAARQGGLLAVRQARELGLAAGPLRTHVGRRGWRPVGPGVWLAPGAPYPAHLRLRTAVLGVGPPVAAARWSAIGLHGIRPVPAKAQVLVPATRRATSTRHVETLRTRTWRDDDVVTIDGVPVTSMARTLVDLAAVTETDTLRGLTVDAIQQRRVDLAQLLDQLARAGRVPGRGRVRSILHDLDAEAVDSDFERRVAAWLRGQGVPVVVQHRIRTRTGWVVLDLALPGRRLAIECDGFGAHSERHHLNLDTRRQNAIRAAGWDVLRLTWDEFTSNRGQFLADLLATLAA